MKRKLSLLLLITVLSIVSSGKLFAQREKIISLVPQYVFQNGFRVDYEFTLRDDWTSWLQLSPTFFISTDGNGIGSYTYKNMRGIGMEVHHKYFMQEPNERRGFYFAYGGGLQLLGVTADQLVAYQYTENGIPYTSYHDDEVDTAINRLLLNVMVGRQGVRHKPFIVDYYLGIGFRYSMDNDFKLLNNYNESWFDYGYSGSLIVAGVKLGFNITK